MATHGALMKVRDTRLFVDARGAVDAPALLYLHGGPGMGCHEFGHWQGDLLSGDLRLIAFDQRGAQRSDPVSEDAPLNEDMLVEDCEALRAQLGIESWTLLGHSFGGRLALRYATRYPQYVNAVIFENPSWDLEATERFRLPVLAAHYDRLGQPDRAQACRELAAGPDMFARGYRLDLLTGLEKSGVYWYLSDQRAKPLMEQAQLDLPEEQEKAGLDAAMRLLSDPLMFESLLPLLPELSMPALLICGAADLVVSPDQVDAFRQQVGGGRVEVFGRTGHFVQFEQPQEYARLVRGFVPR